MIGRITLGLFLGGIVVAAGGLIAWLVVMLRGHDPKCSKRLTLAAAGIAIAALFLNSLS